MDLSPLCFDTWKLTPAILYLDVRAIPDYHLPSQ